MKLYLTLVTTWILCSIIVGLACGNLLRRTWRSQAEQSIRRDALAVAAIASSRNWEEPLEADPTWRQLQRQLGVAVVPLVESESSSSVIGGGAPVQWTRAASTVRVSLDISVSSESVPVRGLRVIREVDPTALSDIWWISWITLNGLACGIGIVGWWAIRSQQLQKKRMLEPWFRALRKEQRTGTALLPEVEFDDDDLAVRLDSVAQNINQVYAELRNATERSDLVFGNLREGVLAVDERSCVLLANKALRRLLELGDENYLYRPLLEIVRTPVLTRLIDRVLQEHVPAEEEVEYGQAQRQLRILARPLPLGHQRTGALVTVRDETLLKRVDMIKRDFVSNASHELKTPLAAIRAYAETLQLGALEDRQAAEDFIANIISQADRLDTLVKGMLQLSRVEEGQTLKIRSFDVAQTLAPCVQAISAVARSKGVTLEIHPPPEPILIKTDRDGFQTIVNNLLSNGIRYTHSGGSVSVTMRELGSELQLEVRDTGVGIAPSDLERIFERFYRAEKDRSAATGGTGLGLSIVKHLAQTLGGNVSATSELNRGSSFVVTLPLEPQYDGSPA